MIAMYIGGPQHGTEEAVRKPPPRTTFVAELDGPSIYGEEPFLSAARVPYKEHEYRLLYEDGRYAVYQWVAPKVTAHWELVVQEDFSRSAELHESIYDMGAKTNMVVRIIGADWDRRECRIRGVVTVDGPADAKAGEVAADEVQAVVEKYLRGHTIVGFQLSLDA